MASAFAEGEAFVGERASVQELADHVARADLLHLACHAEFRSDNPMFSALHLADTALTVEAVERLPLKAATVVLSGCETGLSDQVAGDELLGLVQAFMVAGAARVVATLWPIDDAVAADFMRHFYGALAASRTPAAALREAQLETSRTHPHPYYWAPFVLHGGW